MTVKRTIHISIPIAANEREASIFEEDLAAMVMGEWGDLDAMMSSHAGDCDDNPHCGGMNPWRQRALDAEHRTGSASEK